MYGFIYRLTSPSGKVYIGATTNYPKRMATYAWAGCKGQPYLYCAIVKYGWSNFTSEIIGVGYTKAELDQLEVEAIKEYKACNYVYGYNLACGGQGGQAGRKRTLETRAKMSASRCNISAETRAKLSEAAKRGVVCVTTGIAYRSICEASLATGVNQSNITACCRDKRKTAGKLPDGTKLQWRYA